MQLALDGIRHFCRDCLELVAGPDGSRTLLRYAAEQDLSPEHFNLLLTAAQLGHHHATGEYPVG